MSELNDELLNDDGEDFSEIGEADEEALLQDDEDILSLDQELGDSLETESKNKQADDERKSSRQDKFATERKQITAPEPSFPPNEKPNNNNFRRPNNFNNRGRGRGGMRLHQFNNKQQGFERQFRPNTNSQRGRNKSVFINPRYQGIVQLNNNARLAWDAQKQQQYYPNPWANSAPPGSVGPPQPSMHPPMHQQMPPMQSSFQYQHQLQQFQPPLQMPPSSMGHVQPQFMPAQHQQHPQFITQQPIGMQQGHMQPSQLAPVPSYWDGQNYVPQMQQGSSEQQQELSYQQPNFFEPPANIIINTSQPPPQIPQHNQQYDNFNNSPLLKQQQPLQNNRKVFTKNYTNQGHLFTKRKQGAPDNFTPQKKRFIQDRLGPKKEQGCLKNITINNTEERPSVVKQITVTNVTTVKIEDDQATRDLRMKIEEQKKQRQRLLEWKELRRLQNLKDEEIQQQQSTIRQVQQGRQIQGKGRGGHQQQQIRTIQQTQHGLTTTAVRKPVLQQIKPIDCQLFNKISNNRRVVITAGQQMPSSVEDPDIQVNKTFLKDRKVLIKDETLMSTRRVVIKNIATSTGDKKIIQICKDIGEVQKLQRDKGQATITFKSVASAHTFFKKYQRHMLDLSMIEVSLIPDQSDGQD